MFKREVASKERVKLMVGLTGPSGSGKTYSALQMAYGITGDWSKIAVLDTENRSSLYYAGQVTGEWNFIDFQPSMKGGYHPQNWSKAIDFVETDPNIEVLILDSISHEWFGVGGCLDLVEQYSKSQKGNTFTPWKIVTPLHTSFVDKMRHSRLHVIATIRTSTEYALEKNDQGKTVPKKVGTKPTQREGTDYEFGIIFDLDSSNFASSSKDRTGLFKNQTQPPFLISAETGKMLVQWCKDGVIREPEPTIAQANEEALAHKRAAAVQAFMAEGKIHEIDATAIILALAKKAALSEVTADDLRKAGNYLLDIKNGKLEWDTFIDMINEMPTEMQQ